MQLESIDDTIAEARETGMVRTLLGRLRRLPDLRAKSYPVRMEAERQAMNLTFSLDTSGSMSNSPIERLKRVCRCLLMSRQFCLRYGLICPCR